MAQQTADQSNLITIDGSYLEGGGQILRNSTALSVLLDIPIRVEKIRAGRAQGGLRPQHLTGIQLLAQLSEAKLHNGNIGATEIYFTPKTIKGGNYLADTKTAGSVCLMMQTAIPCLLFANGSSHLRLLGGTNADFAPEIDYYSMVFQPIAKRFNFGFDMNLVRRGYYPRGGGEVRITVNPVDQLVAADLTDFGQIKRFFGRAFVSGTLPKRIAHEMAEVAKNLIHKQYSNEIAVEIEVVKEPDNMATGSATGIIVGAETTTGCILAASALGKREVPAHEVGTQAAQDLLEDLSSQACVDRHLQDQLIIIMALANGHSKIRSGPLTDHTKTAIAVAELLTKTKFTVTEVSNSATTNTHNSAFIIECDGIGHRRIVQMPVKEINDGDLKKELEKAGDKLVLIDFFATWCGPCKKVAPIIEKLSESYPNAVFLKVDVDQCETEARQYEISAMPTFVFIRSSKELERIRGADVDAIEKTLTKHYKATTAFGGEGHSMLETSTATAAVTTETDRERLEKAAQELFGKPSQEQTMTTLRLRLPDISTPVNIRLSTDRTLNEVRHLLCSTISSFETNPFEFMEPPATKIKLEDESKTINEAKLMNAVLTVKKVSV
ncbi:unnamed protein product [Adineta ricciae]|uniref:RNA 3'-terminal phosphate cyclase n=2 Tax=Adineta ricciae TaxID=249248 RepID=A0A813WGN2_ADIRI|nr:unnamed protein product [Adineta ricciae]